MREAGAGCAIVIAAIVAIFVILILYVVAGGTLPGGFSTAHPCGSTAYVNGHCETGKH